MSDHYTKEEVERILTTFEEKVNLVAACQGMDVKLKAAEGNLLERAEKARNVMDKALNGSSAGKLFSPDKRELLKDVFGSDGCYILKRFTAVIEPVKFSEMHEGDQRWKHLQERIWSIEKILGQLGMWKAPSHSSMPANEPSIASPVVARPGHSERLRAAVEEGAAGVISYADLLVSKGTNHGERGESDEQRRCYKRAKAAYEAAGATTSESYAGVLQSMEQLEQLRSAEAEKVQKLESELESQRAASRRWTAALQARLDESASFGAVQAEAAQKLQAVNDQWQATIMQLSQCLNSQRRVVAMKQQTISKQRITISHLQLQLRKEKDRGAILAAAESNESKKLLGELERLRAAMQG